MGIPSSQLPPDIRRRLNLDPPAAKPRKRRFTGDHSQRKHWELVMRHEPGIFIPMRTRNELNDHSSFWNRQKRAGEQNNMVAAALLAAGVSHDPPVKVTLTRYAPKMLDPFDGLPASFKFVVDALCKWWGIDDGPGCPVTVEARQEKSRWYGVRIEINAKEQS
jgi:hypothetical protein